MEVHTARYCLIMWEQEKEIMMCPLFMHRQVQAAVPTLGKDMRLP